MTGTDELVEAMILPACRLVPAVQAEDGKQVEEILAPLTGMQLRALVVVLASLVPADDPAMRLFTTWQAAS